ncbi:MAG TPA: YcnI family protein [Acidimicrobiales bacterium]|jgi:uncharacterized protein YcnI
MNRSIGRRGRLAALGSGAVLLLTVLFASPAWAHVTVHPDTLPAGTGDIELTFRVPNERDNANTVKLQVFFPADLPLLTVNVLPVQGWAAKVDTRTLSQPIQSGDGPVNQVVTDITWTATAGGIAPGQYEDFPISAGQAPSQTGDVIFKSLQTYSSGEIVRWIQVASPQDPSPDTPAPVLTLTGASPTAPVPIATASSSGATEGIAIAALVIALLGLLGVLLLYLRGRRAGAPDHDGDIDGSSPAATPPSN